MSATSIQWTDAVWNPVRGCSLISAGCTNCYAMKQAHRFSGAGMPYYGLTKQTAHGPVWTGRARAAPEMLDKPLRWRKPARIFVNSMSDLFHESVSFEFISAVFGIMAMSQRHTFQVLTKRPARALEWVEWIENDADGATWGCILHAREIAGMLRTIIKEPLNDGPRWPLPNVWLGVSVEDQATVDERIPLLLQTPAAVRFLSCEPLLEAIDIRPYLSRSGLFGFDSLPGINWLIIGGESGPDARPFDVAWARSIRDQCRIVSVPVFVKQLGANIAWCGWSNSENPDWPMGTLKSDTGHGHWRSLLRDRAGGDILEWPTDLRVREFPA